MLCLGIESTAHTFGAAVVDFRGKVLSNEKDSYTTKDGGMIPALAAEHHVDVCHRVVRQALGRRPVKDISLVSFSQGPGLGHTLRVGAAAAVSLALQNRIAIVGVNHCIAHLEIGRLMCRAKDPVMLYASGANTQVIAFASGRYRIFGETLDIGIGNFIDCAGRELGLGFPAGPMFEKLALKGTHYIELPYAVKGMDVSFGGMLTNVKHKIKSGRHKRQDLAYSIQETAFAMLIEVSERAMAHLGRSELLLGGGVACNRRLQDMAEVMCKERKARAYAPPNEFLVDNAAMIAWLGILKYKKQKKSDTDLKIRPYERTDEVDVSWRSLAASRRNRAP